MMETTARGAVDDWVAWPYVDTLYDYTQLLGPDKVMGTVPPELLGTEVAVVGAGVAGMVAAFELLRVGLKPVIFEATGRIGGRCWSRHFSDGAGRPSPAFAEMGAMRVPISDRTFGYYANLFDMKRGTFPDPGVVPTLLYFQDQRYPWKPGTPPPGPFGPIARDFEAFIVPWCNRIWTPWRAGDMSAVREIWQEYIRYGGFLSCYQALRLGIPSWGPEELRAFGALGVGSGGFGPFYALEFLELLRILVNQWDNAQQLYTGGLGTLTDRFYTTKVRSPRFGLVSLQDLDAVRLRTPVKRVAYGIDGDPVITVSRGGTDETLPPFRAVIVAMTAYAMEMIGLTDGGRGEVIDQPVKDAIRDQHLNCSSKMFIRTPTKFWKDAPDMALTIQTDELPRQVYLIDYPDTDNGVVLISYTWADDSARLGAVPVERRFELFRDILGQIDPELGRHLVPVNGEILSVDWQNEPYSYGAFKTQFPGQEPGIQRANYQFLSVLDPRRDRGVYLAGDSVSWSGGWIEGALQTGLNAVSAVIQRVGGTPVANSPLTQDPKLYDYGGVGPGIVAHGLPSGPPDP